VCLDHSIEVLRVDDRGPRFVQIVMAGAADVGVVDGERADDEKNVSNL
jgi:hypothetical protein